MDTFEDTMTVTLASIEKAEFDAVDELSRMSYTHPERAKLHEALINLRVQKRKMLEADGTILRKSANPPPRRFFPGDGIAAKAMANEARDRQSEERRLSKQRNTGQRRYLAPESMRGKPVKLADGSTLDVPAHGICEIADGRHPAAQDSTESPNHRHLVQLGFRPLPDDGAGDAAMDAIKSALRTPITGDRGLIGFLNRNAARA